MYIFEGEDMKKIFLKIYIAICIVTTFGTGIVFAQSIGDIEIINQKLEELYATEYGYVARYATSDLYRGELYIPRAWFVSIDKKEGDPDIYAQQVTTAADYSLPYLRLVYVDKVLKRIRLIVPKEYSRSGVPPYKGRLTKEELKVKFDEQAASGVITVR